MQVVETGLGAVNTAHALARCLQMDLPPWVLQFGVGGAYEGAGLGLGDLALATTESFGDLGVVTPRRLALRRGDRHPRGRGRRREPLQRVPPSTRS